MIKEPFIEHSDTDVTNIRLIMSHNLLRLKRHRCSFATPDRGGSLLFFTRRPIQFHGAEKVGSYRKVSCMTGEVKIIGPPGGPFQTLRRLRGCQSSLAQSQSTLTQFNLSAVGNEEILRFQVTMQHPMRVTEGDSLKKLTKKTFDLWEGNSCRLRQIHVTLQITICRKSKIQYANQRPSGLAVIGNYPSYHKVFQTYTNYHILFFSIRPN